MSETIQGRWILTLFLMKSILRHIRHHQYHHRRPYQNLCRDLSCPALT